MQSRPTTAIAVLLAILHGACAMEPRTLSRESPATEGKPRTGSSRAPDDDDDDDVNRDPAGPSSPAPGSGGAVTEVAQRFPGSKAFVPRRLPAPGLLMLHGSEGGADGTIEEDAAFMAEQGFVVVTLCWFGCASTPDKVLRVSLDRTVEAGTWLGSTVEVGGKKVGLFGWSRGAEQAVLLGSLLKTQVPFAAIATHAASDTVVSAYDPATDGAVMEMDGGRQVVAAAWTFQGAPIFGERTANDFGTGPRIEIEKYPGALFISHGRSDELWEVARSERLVASRSRVPGLATDAHFWPGVGHVIDTLEAQEKFDAAITAFLGRALGQ
jgi:hypothetical protein